MQGCNSKSEQTEDTETKRGSKVQVSAGMLISYRRVKENQSLASVISSFMCLRSKKHGKCFLAAITGHGSLPNNTEVKK